MEDKNQKEVVIYTTPACHFCHMAKDFFEEHGIQYTEHNVASDLEKREEMFQKNGGNTGVPTIDIDGQIIMGFDQEAISGLLGI